jgi:hypothetical protein
MTAGTLVHCRVRVRGPKDSRKARGTRGLPYDCPKDSDCGKMDMDITTATWVPTAQYITATWKVTWQGQGCLEPAYGYSITTDV